MRLSGGDQSLHHGLEVSILGHCIFALLNGFPLHQFAFDLGACHSETSFTILGSSQVHYEILEVPLNSDLVVLSLLLLLTAASLQNR